MKKPRQYTKETYRLRELEVKLQIPLVSQFKSIAATKLEALYPNEVKNYYVYAAINKEYKGLLNQLKNIYGKTIISEFKKDSFSFTKKQIQEYKRYLKLLDDRRVYREHFKFIKPMVEAAAFKLYQTVPKVKENAEVREFLMLMRGLVRNQLKEFYKSDIEEELLSNMFQSCYIAYLQNYDRSFGKVDTFITTHILNELSGLKKNKEREICSEDFSSLIYKDATVPCIVERIFENELDRHLSWERFRLEL